MDWIGMESDADGESVNRISVNLDISNDFVNTAGLGEFLSSQQTRTDPADNPHQMPDSFEPPSYASVIENIDSVPNDLPPYSDQYMNRDQNMDLTTQISSTDSPCPPEEEPTVLQMLSHLRKVQPPSSSFVNQEQEHFSAVDEISPLPYEDIQSSPLQVQISIPGTPSAAGCMISTSSPLLDLSETQDQGQYQTQDQTQHQMEDQTQHQMQDQMQHEMLDQPRNIQDLTQHQMPYRESDAINFLVSFDQSSELNANELDLSFPTLSIPAQTVVPDFHDLVCFTGSPHPEIPTDTVSVQAPEAISDSQEDVAEPWGVNQGAEDWEEEAAQFINSVSHTQRNTDDNDFDFDDSWITTSGVFRPIPATVASTVTANGSATASTAAAAYGSTAAASAAAAAVDSCPQTIVPLSPIVFSPAVSATRPPGTVVAVANSVPSDTAVTQILSNDRQSQDLHVPARALNLGQQHPESNVPAAGDSDNVAAVRPNDKVLPAGDGGRPNIPADNYNVQVDDQLVRPQQNTPVLSPKNQPITSQQNQPMRSPQHQSIRSGQSQPITSQQTQPSPPPRQRHPITTQQNQPSKSQQNQPIISQQNPPIRSQQNEPIGPQQRRQSVTSEHDHERGLASDEWSNVPTITPGFDFTSRDVPVIARSAHVEVSRSTPPITYVLTLDHLRNCNLLEKYGSEVKTTVQLVGLSKFFSFCLTTRLHSTLIWDRDLLFCIAACPFDDDDEVHFQVLQTIYKKLTGAKVDCSRFGGHWEDIGFQGQDPATDLRSVGFLGLLQLLYIVADPATVQLAKDMYRLSLNPTQNFPFAIMSINLTRMALTASRDGRLNKAYNKRHDVFGVFNDLYAQIFRRLYTVWATEHKTICDTGFVLAELEQYVKKHAHDLVIKPSSLAGTSGGGAKSVTNRDATQRPTRITGFTNMDDLEDDSSRNDRPI